ncbi:cytochrome c oxidase assembly protein [Alkalihalophilus sp. As8PL]|uniref:Cytochrome c oxidase assembly protein n=1 Tax=Alkalihalophilus sp. As8PL TaxID=3237103 RepID=A0AB39BX20_9BACI
MEGHHHHQHAMEQNGFVLAEWILASPFIVLFILYLAAVMISNRTHKKWPVYRIGLWTAGTALAVISVLGPLAKLAHGDFVWHMAGHLFLGMLAPLFMVLAAPMTLFLRTLPTHAARKVTNVLRTRVAAFFTDPIIASLLNVGGLWILYTTDLYLMMHEIVALHIFIHFHVFLAGYLFTVSMIYIDPMPHIRSYLYRSVVLVLALAGHGILSKYIYANPPQGVERAQAESGGMLMYYGGDAVDIIIIFILCLHWYKATKPKVQMSKQSPAEIV